MVLSRRSFLCVINLVRAAWTASLVAATLGLAVTPAHAQTVTSLACSPSVIAGGSGGSATCTVTLDAPAPAGGSTVTLASSLSALAASVPSVTVPAGQTNANFVVATNARYRRYSGQAFTAVISATRTTTASATLTVTAQARPADFSSGVQPGQRFQWQGKICGRIGPIQGDAEILYKCSAATKTQPGSCTFLQECNLGCRRVPPNNVTFNDFCATSGPNPVALSRDYAIGGDRVAAKLVTEAPVGTALTQGLPGAISNQNTSGAINGFSVNAGVFPHDGGITIPQGTTSAPFDVATSYVPSPTFIDVVGDWADAGSVVITNGRTGHAWLALAPPTPAPDLPVPTLGDFKITGSNPVTGGQSSIGQIDVSGISSGGGPTITLTSSNPGIASVPATFTMPASTVMGQQVQITTTNPSVDTPVTITATDGRYTFSAVLTVLASTPPLLSSVSVSPSSVVGGGSATGTITLSSGAPSGGAVVGLSTPLPNVAMMPANVTVPAGAGSAQFRISTAPVSETNSVNVTADLAGTQRNTVFTVTPSSTTTTPPPPATYTLTVSASGRNGVSITSSPAGINVLVGSTQSATFNAGASIVLTASDGRDAIWSGACSSGGQKAKSCTFTIKGASSVSANVQ